MALDIHFLPTFIVSTRLATAFTLFVRFNSQSERATIGQLTSPVRLILPLKYYCYGLLTLYVVPGVAVPLRGQ